MESKQFVEHLRNKSHQPLSIALRQALIYMLHNEGISYTIIGNVMRYSRPLMYQHFMKARDLKEVNDKMMLMAMEEIRSHHIVVRPRVIDGDVFKRMSGYNLIIDNIIF